MPPSDGSAEMLQAIDQSMVAAIKLRLKVMLLGRCWLFNPLPANRFNSLLSSAFASFQVTSEYEKGHLADDSVETRAGCPCYDCRGCVRVLAQAHYIEPTTTGKLWPLHDVARGAVDR